MSASQSPVRETAPPTSGEIREPWREWGLALITLGIYAVVRHYRVNRELRDFGIEVDPIRAVLAYFPGGMILVPLLVTVHRTAKRIGVAQETAGLTPSISPELCTIGSIFLALHIPYEQGELNRAWQADAKSTIPTTPTTTNHSTTRALEDR